jgi:hypothetical protein
MSYQKYSRPSGGYGVSAGKGYAGAPGGPSQPAPASEQKPEPFTELSAIFDGVGEYHTNHFVGYFKPPLGVKYKLTGLAQLFYDKFCSIFSANNIARADLGGKFKGLDTVCFEIGGNLGDAFNKATGFVHYDWVSMQMEKSEGKSFYGTTLRREWMEPVEIKVLSSTAGMLAPTFTLYAIRVNQHHFLAGRRSWRVGHDDDLNVFYVETAAFERSSHDEYRVAEKTGRLREDVKKLWTHLVTNFAAEIDVKLLNNYLPSGYEFVGDTAVAYKAEEHESGSAALNAPWFAKVLQKHSGLIKDI